MKAANHLDSEIRWTKTVDSAVPFQAQVNADTWAVRVNDFPDEHLYTLFINGQETESFDEWPTSWVRPEEPVLKSGTKTPSRRRPA